MQCAACAVRDMGAGAWVCACHRETTSVKSGPSMLQVGQCLDWVGREEVGGHNHHIDSGARQLSRCAASHMSRP